MQRLLQKLEGPGVMRILAVAAGGALVAGTVLDVLRREKSHLLLSTPSLVLQGYVIMFGLIIVLNELKSLDSPKLEEWREWVFQWMPFLSVTLGKGLFMILTSSVGLAFPSSMFMWAPSVAVLVTGIIYVVFYLTNRSEQDAAIEQSMVYSPMSDYGGYAPPHQWV